MLKQIRTAMVLCAGKGTRMEELSATCPKPLLPVWGRPMLDHLLAQLKNTGITRLVVNTHHLADRITAHLEAWKTSFETLHISPEATLEGVGGGIRKALPLLRDEAFFVLNGDDLWGQQPQLPLLRHMEEAWNGETSCLLALVPHAHAWGYTGRGDFFQETHRRLRFKTPEGPAAPYVYGGLQLLRASLFHATAPSSAMRPLWLAAQERGGLKGYVWEGPWFHVGTKDAYQKVQGL